MSEKNHGAFVQNFVIKQEPLDATVKDEPSDDEFVETSTNMAIKNELNIFSYETNNNYPVKTQVVEEIDNKYEDQKTILKLEVEEEGIQYDCTEIKSLDCSFCNKSFVSTRGFTNHVKQSFYCNQRLNPNTYWKRFLNQISKPFKCQVCLKCFSTVQNKEQHIKNHFGRSCVICQICGKFVIKQSEFLKHFKLHVTKQLPVKCKSCPKKFITKFIYFKHLQKHKNESSKRYRCKVCLRSFSEKTLKSHNKKEKFLCTYCPRKYCVTSQLTVHLRSHTGEKPYRCAECLYNFSTKGNLLKHSRTHSGYKPYSCKICLKSFSRTDYLNKHYLGIHSIDHGVKYQTNRIMKSTIREGCKEKEKIEVTCGICSNKYQSKQSLISHMRVHTKDKNFQCGICSKTFLYKGILNGHMKTHQDNKPFACTLCPKSFIKRNDLTRHTYTHTKEKNYRCEICFDRFSRRDVLRLHLRSHTGQRPYECDNCLKSFTQKSNLTHHRKKCNEYFEVVVD